MAPLSSYEEWLIDLWHQAGTVGQGAGGLIPLSWPQITSWADRFYKESYVEWVEHPRASKRHKQIFTPLVVEQSTLLDQEIELIYRLSCEYSSEYAAANDPNRECPVQIFLEDVPEDQALQNAESIADGLLTLFGGGTKEPTVEVVHNK